jgi:hypothetical protein
MGNKDAYGAKRENGWQYHVEGALGECAVAKALGIYWNGNIDKFDAPDVGILEVRTSSGEHDRLILHPEDDGSAIFILAIGINGAYELKGWMLGRVGQLDKYWTDPGTGRPAFFVPQEDLYPIETLVQQVAKSNAPYRATDYGDGALVEDW